MATGLSGEDANSALTPSESQPAENQQAEHQPSIWELIDELVAIDLPKLVMLLMVCILVLVLLGGMFVREEMNQGRSERALLFGGFLLILFGLVASVAFVLVESARLNEEKKEEAREAKSKDD
mmetsp:Transcript_37484/g.99635  ORF Transcript_37484/g.99635 Transcript_37484/m.99635 type:complete len:123 (-) Transcript_37484:267-635(-)